MINGVAFKRFVSLAGAKIDGDVTMFNASFDSSLDASGLQVGGSLAMPKSSFKEGRARQPTGRPARSAPRMGLHIRRCSCQRTRRVSMR